MFAETTTIETPNPMSFRAAFNATMEDIYTLNSEQTEMLRSDLYRALINLDENTGMMNASHLNPMEAWLSLTNAATNHLPDNIAETFSSNLINNLA